MQDALSKDGSYGEIVGGVAEPGLEPVPSEPDTCSTEDYYTYEKEEPVVRTITEPYTEYQKVRIQGTPVVVTVPGSYVLGVGWVGSYTYTFTPSTYIEIPITHNGKFEIVQRVKVVHHYHCETEITYVEEVVEMTAPNTKEVEAKATLISTYTKQQVAEANAKALAAAEAAKTALLDKFQQSVNQITASNEAAMKQYLVDISQAIQEQTSKVVQETLAMLQESLRADAQYQRALASGVGRQTTYTFGAIRDVYMDKTGSAWIMSGGQKYSLDPGTKYTSTTWPFPEKPIAAGTTLTLTGVQYIGNPITKPYSNGITVNLRQSFYPKFGL